MKIVHIIFGFNTGGSETMLVDIMNEQVSLGHEVTLIVINDCYTEDILNKISPHVKRIMLNRAPSSHNPVYVLLLNWHIWRLNPDAIHLHNESITKMLFTYRPGYLTVHALDISLSTSCKMLTELFAISNAVKEDVEKRYPGKYRVKTIPNGIRVADIKRKKEYLLKGKGLRVVQVGSLLSRIKGQDLLIEALAILKGRGIDGIDISFIGEPYEVEMLSTKSRDLGLDNKVHFLGLFDRDYIYSHLKDFDLMCHPSRHEGFGLTVAEGIAAGLPVLVPDCDGPYEIIKHGEFGYTFKKGDVESLADALQDIYEHYEERAGRVVDAAYEHVKANYSIQHMVKQYIEEYKKALV